MYVVVTPVRDEEKYIESTIKSMLSQTVTPAQWIIVNDGSGDRTGEIIDKCAAEIPWVRAYHRADRGHRLSGGGVMEAFHDGYRSLTRDNWKFLVKLDADLSFSDDYFERALRHFADQPTLGIGGGTLYHMINGKETVEVVPRFHVRGATKIYRRRCWDEIDGLWRGPGWDMIDEVTANMLGWTTASFPELRVMHHRYTGTGDTSWREACKNGRGSYCSGYHPLYLAARCCYLLFRKPYLIGSLGMGYGYLTGYLRGLPRINNTKMIEYLRKQQLARLCGAKSIWK